MIKFIHSGMTGAPALSGQVGKLLDVLNAALVDGFGSGTVDSLVIAGGVATVTRSGGHPFEVGSIALIGGATVTGGSVNGERRVLSVTGTTYTFDATGIGNQTATGTITHKVAPLGWTKPYAGTNLAAYKMAAGGTDMLLRVDDTNAQNARVVGYEAMTGIDTGTGPFPTAAQVSGGAYWTKSSTADATARGWVVAGDEWGFTIYLGGLSSGAGYAPWFGDFLSRKAPDPYKCMLVAPASSVVGSGNSSSSLMQSSQTPSGAWIARGVSGLGGSQGSVARQAFVPGAGDGIYSGGAGPAFPNPADNGLFLSAISIAETSPTIALRGTVPGVYFAAANISTTVIAHRDTLTGVDTLPGRTLKALGGVLGPLFVDITGPWR